MREKRQREQRRLDPDLTLERGSVPPPFPMGPLSALRNVDSPRSHQGQWADRSVEDTSAPEMRGLYIISVAAGLLEMHPQTLRKYERIGLVSPSRTMGMLRLYSQQDIARLRLIKHLVDDLGMNLAGVEFVLHVTSRLYEAKERIVALEEERQLKETVGQELESLLQMLNTAFGDSEEG